jgi:hypothetical protein
MRSLAEAYAVSNVNLLPQIVTLGDEESVDFLLQGRNRLTIEAPIRRQHDLPYTRGKEVTWTSPSCLPIPSGYLCQEIMLGRGPVVQHVHCGFDLG